MKTRKTNLTVKTHSQKKDFPGMNWISKLRKKIEGMRREEFKKGNKRPPPNQLREGDDDD
jgi:hypothetical protein